MKIRILSTLLCCGLCASVSTQGATVTYSSTAPGTDILASLAGISETDRTWRWRTESGTSNHRDIMQTFTLGGTGTYSVDRFTLRIDTTTSPDPEGAGIAGAVARIVIYNLTNNVDTTPNSVLAQESFTVAAGSIAGDYFKVTLATTLTLTAGSTYGFGLILDSAVSNQFLEFATRIGTNGNDINASEYSGGANLIRQTAQNGTFTNDLASWGTGSGQADQDLVFYVQGVPEPSSLAMFGVAALWLGTRRRRA